MNDDSTTSQPTRSPTASRWLWTLAPIAFGLAAPLLNVPGSASRLGAFSIGLMPIFFAFGVVETVAALVPGWAKARTSGFAARKRLKNVAVIVALLIAVYQASGYVAFALRSNPGGGNAWVGGVVLVATFAIAIAVAELATRRGLGNGYISLVVATLGRELVVTSIRQHGDAAAALALRSLWLPGVGLFGVVILTFLALKGHLVATPKSSVAARDAGYRAVLDSRTTPIVVPTPASGLVPLWLVVWSFALTSAALLEHGGGQTLQVIGEHRFYESGFVWVVLLTVISARLQNAPARVAIVSERATGEKKDYQSATARARAAMRAATWQSVLFVTSLFALTEATSIALVSSMMAASLAVAVVMDLRTEVGFMATHRDIVSVWPEHRPYAALSVASYLERHGIPALLRNRHQRTLMQFFGSFAPIEICVPIEHRARAATLARKCLSPRSKDERLEKALSALPSKYPLPKKLLWATGLATVVIGVMGYAALGQPRPEPVKSARAKDLRLELVAVDDTTDPLESVDHGSLDAEPALPTGVSIQLENAPIGAGKTRVVRFARILPRDGETVEAALVRARPFFQAIHLPPGDHFGFERVIERNADTQRFETIGYRTILLHGKPILTEREVKSASPFLEDSPEHTSWNVVLELTAEGGRAFQIATAAQMHHRFAIVVNGIVRSAPRIDAEIVDGNVLVSMGQASLDDQRHDAYQLAEGIGTL